MTHNDLILRYLKAGHTICDDEARTLFNCNRLGARIYELREKGHDIGSREEANIGKPGTHARYYWRSDKRITTPINQRMQARDEKQGDLFAGAQ